MRLGVGLGILYYIFTFIPFGEVVATISSAKGTFVAMALTVLILERFTAALRVKILTDRVGMALPLLTIWEINTISSFYATFLPGELAGGAVRWYKLSRPGGKRAEALAVITFERLVGTIALG